MFHFSLEFSFDNIAIPTLPSNPTNLLWIHVWSQQRRGKGLYLSVLVIHRTREANEKNIIFSLKKSKNFLENSARSIDSKPRILVFLHPNGSTCFIYFHYFYNPVILCSCWSYFLLLSLVLKYDLFSLLLWCRSLDYRQ